MKNTKRKIKWSNVFKLIIMLACFILVIHDLYMVGFSQFFTGEMVGWTWFGFSSFIAAFYIGGSICEEFIEKYFI